MYFVCMHIITVRDIYHLNIRNGNNILQNCFHSSDEFKMFVKWARVIKVDRTIEVTQPISSLGTENHVVMEIALYIVHFRKCY